jgi:DNA-binding SARP family transcriptional activator
MPRGSAQVRLALAMLTVERARGVTRDQLADALWPEGLPATWGSALRTIVSRVRACVEQAFGEAGPATLVAGGGVYRLRLPGTVAVDVEEAERALTAADAALAAGEPAEARRRAAEGVDRLRRPFLPEHDGDWVAAQRDRLAGLVTGGLETQSRAAAALGDHAGAIAAAEEAIALAPLREAAHRCLMAAHVVAGNRAEALRGYQRLRRLLAEELGVDPDAATEAAYLDLLGAPPAGRGRAADPGLPFVGRDEELDEAHGHWARACGAGGGLLLVSGDEGVGKSRTVRELARRVTGEGGLVLFGACEPDAHLPYQPFAEIVDALVARLAPGDWPPLSLRSRSALAALVPSVGRDGAGLGEADRPFLHDAVGRLLARAAQDQPLLVVVEDAHWADEECVALLRAVLRRARPVRLLVVVVARRGRGADHPLDGSLRALERDGAGARLALAGLGVAACAELVRRVRPDTPRPTLEARRLHAATGGNPALLGDLLRGDGPRSAALPPELVRRVTARLAALTAEGRALVEAAAVCGDGFDPAVAASAAEVAPEALEAAVAAGVVAEPAADGEPGHRFAHAVVREAVYDGLPGPRLRRLHARVADALEARAPGEVVALAHHRCAAAEPVGDVLAVSAALAAAEHDPGDAPRWCRRALDHVAPGDDGLAAEVLLALGTAEARAGDAEAWRSLFDSVVRARRAARGDVAARAALALADAAGERPELRPDAGAVAQAVLRAAGASPAGAARAPHHLWARLVACTIELGAGTAHAVTQAATASGMLRRHLLSLGGPCRLDERRRVAHALGVLAAAREDGRAGLLAHHHQAMVAAVQGDAEVLDVHIGALASAGDRRLPELQGCLEDRAAATAVTRGQLARLPGRGSGLASEPPGEWGPPAPGELVAGGAVVAAWLQGRPLTPAAEPGTAREVAEAALADVARGQRGRARLALREALADPAVDPGDDDEWLHCAGLLGLAAAVLDDRPVAEALYHRLLPHASLTCGVGYRSFAGTAAFHLGRLAVRLGEWSAAEHHLSVALRQLGERGARPWVALAQTELAQVIEERGGPSSRVPAAVLRAEAAGLARSLRLPARR